MCRGKVTNQMLSEKYADNSQGDRMKPFLLALYAVASLLFTGATLASADDVIPPVAPCGDFATLGHSYYEQYRKNAGAKPIAQGTLHYYEQEGVLSRLDMSGDLNNALVTQRQFALSTTERGPQLHIEKKLNKYISILIPPAIAAEYLAQQEQEKPLAAFLMVPEEAFYKGICRQGVSPFIIGSSLSLSEAALPVPQLMISGEDLKSLVSALYLDRRSNNLEDLATYYKQIFQKSAGFVNIDTWNGWSEITVKPRHRGFLRRTWNYLSGSLLGQLGTVEGTSRSFGVYNAPPLAKIVTENLAIENRWRARVDSYTVQNSLIQEKVKQVLVMLESPTADGVKLSGDAKIALDAIQSQRDILSNTQASLGDEEGYFVTKVEIAYVMNILNNQLDELYSSYSKAMASYASAIAIKPGKPINANLILNPPPAFIEGTEYQAIKTPFSISLAKFGGNLTADTVVILEPVSQPNKSTLYKIRVIGLINLTSSMQQMRAQLDQRIRAEERCSLHIRFINFDIPDSIGVDQYEKHVDVGLTVRACATFTYYRPCGNWYWPKICEDRATWKTDLFNKNVHGTLGVRIDRISDDFRLGYQYEVCEIFCTRNSEATPLIMETLKSNKIIADLIAAHGAKVDSVGFSKGTSDDNKYLAIQLVTGPLDAATTLLALNKLKAGGK